jgi:hypothetical protein
MIDADDGIIVGFLSAYGPSWPMEHSTHLIQIPSGNGTDRRG